MAIDAALEGRLPTTKGTAAANHHRGNGGKPVQTYTVFEPRVGPEDIEERAGN